MDVSTLAVQWEADDQIRDRVRQLKKLCVYPSHQRYCEPSRANCTGNSRVLEPALAQLRETPKWQLPHIEPLQAEIAKLLEQLGCPMQDQYIYTASIEVKKLLGFVKRRAVRREVTKDSFSPQGKSTCPDKT